MQSTKLNTFGPSTVMYRFVLTYADLTAAATTQTINLMALTKGTLIRLVRIKHQASFTGGSISAMTVSVGAAAGTATTFAGAFNVFQAAADTTFQAAAASNACATYAADTLQCKFTSTSDNVNAATAGMVTIDVEMWEEPDLTGTGPFGAGGTAGAPAVGGGAL